MQERPFHLGIGKFVFLITNSHSQYRFCSVPLPKASVSQLVQDIHYPDGENFLTTIAGVLAVHPPPNPNMGFGVFIGFEWGAVIGMFGVDV